MNNNNCKFSELPDGSLFTREMQAILVKDFRTIYRAITPENIYLKNNETSFYDISNHYTVISSSLSDIEIKPIYNNEQT